MGGQKDKGKRQGNSPRMKERAKDRSYRCCRGHAIFDGAMGWQIEVSFSFANIY